MEVDPEDQDPGDCILSYFRVRDYQEEHSPLFSTSTDTHPLSSIHSADGATAGKGGATVGDPLTRLMEGSDPLSLLAASDPAPDSPGGQLQESAPGESPQQDWSVRRRAILAQFTTSKLVTIATRSNESGADTVAVHSGRSARARLAQLDPDDEAGRAQLTQQEFVAHMGRMKIQLQEAWQADQRVRALKLVIQACKTLEDVSVPQFYPSMFVLVTDLLDVFGGLVYNRVTAKDWDDSTTVATPSGDLVTESGRETCRNWFYKISSIRELLARLYVEMAVLRCYDLLQPGGAEEAALRLVTGARGVGSPLAAGFARCYLSRVAPAAAWRANLDDFVTTLAPRTIAPSWAAAEKVAPPSAAGSPPLGAALEWCMARALAACAPAARDAWLEELQERDTAQSSLLLMALLRSAGPGHLSARSVQYVQAVADCQTSGDVAGYRRCDLLAALGDRLTAGRVPAADRLHTLNAGWRQIQELATAAEYMHCAPAWCAYVTKYFGPRQLSVMLRDVVDHVSPDRQFEQHYVQLETLLTLAMGDGSALPQLVQMASFASLLELLQQDDVRQRVSRRLLQLLLDSQLQLAAEPALVEHAMGWCQTLHDSVTMLSLDDERRETSALIIRFLRRAADTSHAQLESSLDLLVQARGAFCNLESVTSHLVTSVHSLAASARDGGGRRRRAFSAACVAYCFITLPALDDVLLRLRLYAATAQLALSCGCLGQADACIRAAIAGLPEIGVETGPPERRRSSLPQTLQLVRVLLSALLVFPDQPSQSALYLERGLLAALDRIAWLQGTDSLACLMLDFVHLLAALSQPRYLYSVAGVDSNDTLYGGDPQLTAEIAALAAVVIRRMTSHLRLDEPASLGRVQARLTADLCLCLLRSGDLQNPEVASVTAKLYKLCDGITSISVQHRSELRAALQACRSSSGTGRGGRLRLLADR